MNQIELTVSEWGGACPFQAEGTINGKPFYFRARHGSWTLEVAEVGDDPVRNATLYYAEGDDETHGFMKQETAAALLGKEAWKFKLSMLSSSAEEVEAQQE